MTVYNHLAQDQRIDLHQVFLFGTSAETRHLSRLVGQNPVPWKGLILLSPSVLPDVNSSKAVPILISTGGSSFSPGLSVENDAAFTVYQKYQQDAWHAGIPVDCVFHPGSGHILMEKSSLRARTRAMVHFVFDNCSP